MHTKILQIKKLLRQIKTTKLQISIKFTIVIVYSMSTIPGSK